MPPLFTIPAHAASVATDDPGAPAGGFGAGCLALDGRGRFRRWRLEPEQPERDAPVPQDRFMLWLRERPRTACVPLTRGHDQAAFPQRRLFPLTWTDYGIALDAHGAHDLQLESVAFSPLLSGKGHERSLPLHIVAFRAHNRGSTSVEAALMLTWTCAWPETVESATFDFQHDNLCLTGSLGAAASPVRQGIALPDLHYVGIYRQGMEPWAVGYDDDEIADDFACDGELDPRVVRRTPHGTAAWVRFDLEPGETKEVPFGLTWHFPQYAGGDLRYYTQFLGRRRPDNAVVWLAEQAFQHYGAETANYVNWQHQISEWHRALWERRPQVAWVREVTGAVARLLENGTVWHENGEFVIADGLPADTSPDVVRTLRETWPDILNGVA